MIDDDDIDVAAPAPKQRISARAAALIGARTAAGLIGVGIAVVLVLAATFLPLPTVKAVPPGERITPVPTAQQLVCPGAALRLANDFGQRATEPSPIGAPATQFASSSGPIDSRAFTQSDASTGHTAAAPSTISAPPNQAEAGKQILLSGAQAQSVSEAEFVGLAAADCAVANGDAWLVGGSTSVGRTTLLTLDNPSEVASTVTLELFGESGPIVAPGTSGIIVPPNGQRVLSLAGFKRDVASPVVHVMSTGGQILANLQQSTVRGLAPGGFDIFGPTTSPSTENVIPGLLVTDVVEVQNLQVGGESFNDLPPSLRLFAPGEGTVATTVNVVPENGQGTGASLSLDVEAGRVVDLPIADLDTGSYTVKVSSKQPLVAAVRVSSAKGAANDFAWLAATPDLSARAQFTVAPGPGPILHLSNPGKSDETVRLTARSGGRMDVTVPAGASVAVAVTPSTTYELTGFEELFGAVTFTDGNGGIARYGLHPPGAGSTPIRVYS